MASSNLLAQRDKIQRQIEELERSLETNDFGDDILSSDSSQLSDESSQEEEQPVSMGNLAAKRKRIQREIKELELTLGSGTSAMCPSAMDIEILSDENDSESIVESSGEESDELFSLPLNVETCLQMNLVYQDVLEEKLTELERLLIENKEQQKEVMVQVSGPTPQATTCGLPPLKVFLGHFMKPYFKDKATGLGPPGNPETREKMNLGTRTYDEMKIRKWEGWQKTLLLNSIVSDTMKRMLQPKLSKLDYLNEKMSKAEDMEKHILQKQIDQIDKEIDDISSMREEQLMGSRHDDHDWEKISNIDFEGTRTAEDIRKFWVNYLHPSINKSSWKEDEIEKLKIIVENRNFCDWEQIAEELGTNRTAFMCLQTHQRYINKGFKKRLWTKEEDQIFRELVDKMRIGNFIPYTQISYFMEGREAVQLVYRWTQVLDPTLKKGSWTKEEDEMLLKAVAKYGVRDWWKIRTEVPGRTDSQCRERYLDCLSEDVKKGPWSPEEELMLIKLVQKYGVGRWAKIASEMPNRIDCQCLHKWKRMTRYPMTRRVGQPSPKKREDDWKTLKRTKKEEEDRFTSEEEEVVCDDELPNEATFEEEEEEEESKDESSIEIKPRKEYILPSMEKWIPKNCDLFPHLSLLAGKGTRVGRTDKNASQSQDKLGRPCLSSVPSPLVRCTILDRLGSPLSTNVRMASPERQLQENQHCESDTIKVTLSEVRSLLRWNGGSKMKQRCRRTVLALRRNNLKNKNKRRVRNNGTDMSCEGQGSVVNSAQSTRTSVSGHVCSAFCMSLNDELLLAISPWVGDVILPLATKKDECCKVDLIIKKTEIMELSSTPVFSLFLKILSIDAEGCKKVIEARSKKESCIPHQVTPPTKISTPSAPSRKRTVAQMLCESREKESGMKKNDLRKSSYIMTMPQPVVTQPLLQRIGHLTAPTSSAFEKPTVAKGVATCVSMSQEHPWKPKKKAQMLTNGSKPKKSRNNKKAHLQDGKNLSDVPFTTQPLITWIMTPNGLLPVCGVGIPETSQTQSLGMYSNLSSVRKLKPIAVKPNNSSAFSVSQAPSAASPSNVLYVNPSICIPTGLPTSFGLGTAVNLATSSSASVSAPHCNSTSPLGTHFLLTKPVAPMPAPTSVNTCRSVAGPAQTVSQATPFTRVLTHPQRLPFFQVSQTPHTPQIIAKPSLNTVVAQPEKSASLSPLVFSKLKPNISPVNLSSTPTLHKTPRPEPTLDPSLVSAEEASLVTEWMKGIGGVRLPQMDRTLPYLPPFVSSLTALTTLLHCKSTLERSALPLISCSGDKASEEAAEKGIRRLVAERLSSNRAYLLLKARFLSCFSLPAFLATVNPREDEEQADDVDPQGGEGKPKDGALRTDGKGAVADEFSGMTTRHRNLSNL
ncbi:hypothetical protein GJAV_G00028520 [Gymnothorax javanicus]|nr:hypothetical protein GJAV_G00028520 [Gymnothorax javanicus]